MKHSFFALLVLIPLLACQDSMNIYEKPDSIIDVKQLIPDAVFDLRYASSNNFTGKQVPGYKAAKCLLDHEAAHALQKVQQNAKAIGLRLIIFDCYRPLRAVNDFMNWLDQPEQLQVKDQYHPQLSKPELLGPYIAEKSEHSKGFTLDVSLAKQNASGEYQEIEMGSSFDLFDPISNTDDPSISLSHRKNRYLLKELMEGEGFIAYDMEWWHFTYSQSGESELYYDFVIR